MHAWMGYTCRVCSTCPALYDVRLLTGDRSEWSCQCVRVEEARVAIAEKPQTLETAGTSNSASYKEPHQQQQQQQQQTPQQQREQQPLLPPRTPVQLIAPPEVIQLHHSH